MEIHRAVFLCYILPLSEVVNQISNPLAFTSFNLVGLIITSL